MKKLQIKVLPELPYEMTEAINQLRINLSFCGDDVKTIMISSSLPNEGKSFITMQLWRMMAETGTPTLLVDCDFRNSELRSRYGLTADEKLVGGAHYLAGKVPLQDVLYQTSVPNGYLIPVTATIANPAMLLESARFKEMITYCSKSFGCVLIDTPPLENVADALKIATNCDGAVLIVRSGETPRKVVVDSIQQLHRTGTPLLGLVLNRMDINGKSNMYYRRYYHSSYYHKHYGNYYNSNKNK